MRTDTDEEKNRHNIRTGDNITGQEERVGVEDRRWGDEETMEREKSGSLTMASSGTLITIYQNRW